MSSTKEHPWFDKYTEGTDEIFDIPEVSLYKLLENTTNKFSSNTAIIFEDKKITYRQLKDQIDCLADAWHELGAEKGERIGLMITNHPDYILAYYAALKLGMTIVQINPMYTPRELLEIFKDAQLSYLVVQSVFLSKIQNLHDFKHVFSSGTMDNVYSFPIRDMTELIEYSKPTDIKCPINSKEDIAVIQYTGGTTGKKKGAMLTHYNLIANIIQSKILYGDKIVLGEEIILTAIPLYHVYGMTAGMNLGIYTGAANVIVPTFEIKEILRVIQTYKPTFLPGVPKMYSTFVHYPNIENYGLDCFKICTSGSAPLPVEIIRKFESMTGSSIGEGYGLSETSPTTHRNPPFGLRKIGSIGNPLPGTECRIVDENGNDVTNNSIGELVIKGPQVMLGYWNKEQETIEAFQDGWFLTGDLATMDEDGYYYIVGRKKEMIIIGGFNIYPQEVEGVLYEYPGVQEAAVIGIPDQDGGEMVKAFIVPKEGELIDINSLKAHCYLHLTRYKVPKIYELRDSLPRNSVGKLLKRLLTD